MYLCRIFKTVDEGGIWYKYTARGKWEGANAGGCTNYASCIKNPQYAVAPSKPATLFIQLKVETCARKETAPAVGFSLYDEGGKRATRYSTPVADGAYQFRGSSVECSVRPNTTHFSLLVSTFAPNVTASYLLTIFSDVPLTGLNADNSLKLIPSGGAGTTR